MWALSSARLERRSYMTTRLFWRVAKLTGGRRFKSARAHISYIYTFSLFFLILLTPYIILTTPYFSSFFIELFSSLDKNLIKFVVNCINSYCDFNYGKQFGFKEEEILHLVDVKNFLNWLRIIYFFCLFSFLILSRFTSLNKKLFFILVIFFVLLFLFSLLNFNFMFEIFHKIFFKKNYSFPLSSLLIQIFPEKFFVVCFFISSIFSFIFFVIVIYVYRIYKMFSNKNF